MPVLHVKSPNGTKYDLKLPIEASSLIAGSVIAYAGSDTPTGYLLCDGSAVSRSAYAALFAAIGTTYGSGDGSTTFNLPNLTDRVIQSNSTVGSYRNAGLPNLYGRLGCAPRWMGTTREPSVYARAGVFGEDGNAEYWTTDLVIDSANGYSYNQIVFNATWYNSIYGNSNTVQPPALTMRYIIKY